MLPCCKKNCLGSVNVEAIQVGNQQEFIRTHVKKLPCKTQTTGNKQKKRDFHRIYHLLGYDGKWNKVCKTAFMRCCKVSCEQIHEALLDVSCVENFDSKVVQKAIVKKTVKPVASPTTTDIYVPETNIRMSQIPLSVTEVNEGIQICEPPQTFIEQLLSDLPDENQEKSISLREPLPDLVQNHNKIESKTLGASQNTVFHAEVPTCNSETILKTNITQKARGSSQTYNPNSPQTIDELLSQYSPETECSYDTCQHSPYLKSQYEGQELHGSVVDTFQNSPENVAQGIINEMQKSPGSMSNYSCDTLQGSPQMHSSQEQGLSPQHEINLDTPDLSMFQKLPKEQIILQEKQNVQPNNFQQLPVSEAILPNDETYLSHLETGFSSPLGLSPPHNLQNSLQMEKSDISMLPQYSDYSIPHQQQQNVRLQMSQQMAASTAGSIAVPESKSGTYYCVSATMKRPFTESWEAEPADPLKRQKTDVCKAQVEPAPQSNDVNDLLMNNTFVSERWFSDICSLNSEELLSEAGGLPEMLDSFNDSVHPQSQRMIQLSGSRIRLQQTEPRSRRMEDFVETARMTFGENGNIPDLKARVPEEEDLSNMMSNMSLKEKEMKGEYDPEVSKINRYVSRSKDDLYRPPSRTTWDTSMLYDARTEEVLMRPANLPCNEINNYNRQPGPRYDATENEDRQSEVPSSASAARRIVRGEYCSIRVRGRPNRPPPEHTEAKPKKPKKKYSKLLCCFS